MRTTQTNTDAFNDRSRIQSVHSLDFSAIFLPCCFSLFSFSLRLLFCLSSSSVSECYFVYVYPVVNSVTIRLGTVTVCAHRKEEEQERKRRNKNGTLRTRVHFSSTSHIIDRSRRCTRQHESYFLFYYFFFY